jgi:hypothetical protein
MTVAGDRTAELFLSFDKGEVEGSLPRAPNGEVDRRALPPPGTKRPSVDTAVVAPRSELEQVVATIWAEVLGLDMVGVLDEFLELGSHSLLATQAVARLRRALGVDLPLRALFETPTAAGLAPVLASMDKKAGRPHAPVITVLPRQTGSVRAPPTAAGAAGDGCDLASGEGQAAG